MPEPEWIAQIDPITRAIEAIRVNLKELECETEPDAIRTLIADCFGQLRKIEANRA